MSVQLHFRKSVLGSQNDSLGTRFSFSFLLLAFFFCDLLIISLLQILRCLFQPGDLASMEIHFFSKLQVLCRLMFKQVLELLHPPITILCIILQISNCALEHSQLHLFFFQISVSFFNSAFCTLKETLFLLLLFHLFCKLVLSLCSLSGVSFVTGLGSCTLLLPLKSLFFFHLFKLLRSFQVILLRMSSRRYYSFLFLPYFSLLCYFLWRLFFFRQSFKSNHLWR